MLLPKNYKTFSNDERQNFYKSLDKNEKEVFETIEYAKCSVNPIYYIDNYGHVFNARERRITRMECYPYQKKCLKMFHKFRNNIILKSRQTGLSAVTAGYVAWRLLFNIDEKILIIANDGVGAKRFLKTVKQYVEETPAFLKPDEQITWNQTKIEFSNRSWAEARASSPDAGRGEGLTLLVLDETAFIKDADDIWMAAGMALSMTKGKCIMISTPNGTGNLYYNTWVQAEKRRIEGLEKRSGDFKTSTVHWTENPIAADGLETRFDDNGMEYLWSPWYEEQCERLHHDEVKIAQELDLDFGGSKRLAVSGEIIRKYIKRLGDKEPLCYFHYDFKSVEDVWDDVGRILMAGQFALDKSPFHVWERPVPGKRYIIGVDVATGAGRDFSTIQIIDVDTLEQVAEYQAKVAVDMLYKIVYCIARNYNDAYLVVEANSFGTAVALDLKNKMKYKNMHQVKSIKKIHVSPMNIDVNEGDEIPGFQTTSRTRPLMINALVIQMRMNELKINSMRLLREFETFILKETAAGVRPEAEKGFNDDLIMAIAMAIYIRDTEYLGREAAKEHYKSMLDSIVIVNSGKPLPASAQKPMDEKEKGNLGTSLGIFTTNPNVDAKEEDINDTSWLIG